MLKTIKIKALAWRDRLSLRLSKQPLLCRARQVGIGSIAVGALYVIGPPLWDAISVSPQQRVEPLKQRIDDLDQHIKASPTPATADLKEIATLEKGRIETENTIRTSLFQAIGGLLVFVTLYISYRTLKANEAKQVAERFSKAVEQLGNDNIHVRLGGIYALEQIAKDAEETYYWQVMETLTSYVRERSPCPPKAANKPSSFVQAALETSNQSQSDAAILPLPVDIQAVMTVIARLKHRYGHPLERHPLDLSHTDLRRVQLPLNTQLAQANLSGTNLQQSVLAEANLQKADLAGANLQEVDLAEANLQRANLVGANLQGADLWKTNLQEASLLRANLQGAQLVGVNLQGANLWETNLQEVGLWGANLQGAYLMGANLQKASLGGANLRRARFKENNSRLVSYWKIQETIGLTWEQLEGAASYEGAILPDYLLTQPSPAETTPPAPQATASA